MKDRGHSLRAGAARVDITTDDPAAVIRDPLYAKVLVLDDGSTRLAIVAMDTTAIGGRHVGQGYLEDVGEEFLPRLRERVERELDIAGRNVLVNASHTHPPGRLLCDDHQQVERTFDAVRRAAEGMEPVRAGSGSGSEDRISMNRTLRLKNGMHWTLRHANPSPPADEVVGAGPLDPEIGLLRFDRMDGRPLAVVYNFACHPLWGEPRGALTADYPGVAARVMEEALGGDTIALFLQGAAGDIIDVSFKDFSKPRDIEPHGVMLGNSALEGLREIATGDVALRVLTETLDLPLRTDIPGRIDALLERQDALLKSLRSMTFNFELFLPMYERYVRNPVADDSGDGDLSAMDSTNRGNLEKYMKNLRAMEELARIQDDVETLKKHQGTIDELGGSTVSAELQGIRIGDAVLVSSPAEVLAEVGLNVKRASPHRHTFVAAFSNGYLHYGPPAAYYDKGGYEVTECMLAPEWQRIFEDKAAEVIARL